MVTPSTVPKHHLHPLNTSWHNTSMSSISATSEAATFHSAHAHHPSNLELRPLSQPFIPSSAAPALATTAIPSPKLISIKMDRQDSGYAETPRSPNSSRRTST